MGQDEVSERGVLTAPDGLWEVAVRQAAVISRLAALDSAGVIAVDEAANELELSRRQAETPQCIIGFVRRPVLRDRPRIL
ncbi:hypothetical protein ACFPJ1_01795 [Kribbella qitaiheensis]|uniref:hypothetical protein n=1 Tax=Kribbella qitaiheensis TaxID=1544730 RepID=UPI00360C6408